MDFVELATLNSGRVCEGRRFTRGGKIYQIRIVRSREHQKIQSTLHSAGGPAVDIRLSWEQVSGSKLGEQVRVSP